MTQEIIKLDPTLKLAWIASLRSGRYPQSSGKLRNYNGYCCYGVLCELKGIPAVWDEDFKCYRYAEERHNLPKQLDIIDANHDGRIWIMVPEWLRFPSGQASWSEGTVVALDNLNDAGVSFEDIARLIEEQL